MFIYNILYTYINNYKSELLCDVVKHEIMEMIIDNKQLYLFMRELPQSSYSR